MRWRRSAILTVAVSASLSGVPARAQQSGGMMGGGVGMMGMRHDSATRDLMMVIHQLVANHQRITRSVTNLPNGIRTVTESDDPRLASLIRQHVGTAGDRVTKGDDPGLPMESAAVREIFASRDKIRTTMETTSRGIVVIQVSDDAKTVAALQKHAAEVSDLVAEGMPAMHRAMMNGRGMTHGDMHGMHGGMSMDTSARGHASHATGETDTAFAAMQQRGKLAMGVDQYTSTHQFEALPDGGRIELQRDADDPAGVAQIRQHLQEIVKAFGAGEFNTPALVHMQEIPGAREMSARRAAIAYSYRELPRGGEVRMLTRDAKAIAAIHEFLAFQRKEHR